MARRPLILHYAGGIDYAGGSRSMEQLVRHLDKDRFDVHILYRENADNCRLAIVRDMLGSDKLHGFRMYLRVRRYYSPVLSTLPTTLRRIRRDHGPIDIFHFHRSGYTEYPMVPALRRQVRWFVEKNVFGFDDSVVPPDLSLCNSDHILKRRGPRDNAAVLYNGVDPPCETDDLRAELGLAADAIVLGRIGRPDNFTPIALEAYARIGPDRPPYVIVNPCRRTRNFVARHGLEQVMFLDRIVDDRRLSRFYNTIDILAHYRSDGETCGRNIQEAMIHGVPVVSHGSPLFNAQVEVLGRGGFVVENAEGYEQRLRELIEDASERRRIGELGRQRAATVFSNATLARQLEGHYERLLAR